MRNPHLLVLLIPVFNYESGIAELEKSLVEWKKKLKLILPTLQTQIVFSDDGSTDQTTIQLNALCTRQGPSFALLQNKINRGKGSALKSGYLFAEKNYEPEFIVFTDCDLHYGLDIIQERVLPELSDHDLVMVDRFWTRKNKASPFTLRSVASLVFNRFVTILTGVPYRDTQAGLKAFRAAHCTPLFQAATIDGFTIDVELLSLALFYRFRIGQISIEYSKGYTPPKMSSVRLFSTSIQMLRELVKINLNWHRGVYKIPELHQRLSQKIYVIG